MRDDRGTLFAKNFKLHQLAVIVSVHCLMLTRNCQRCKCVPRKVKVLGLT